MTTFAGLKVSMRALKGMRKRGGVDGYFINSLLRYNKSVFGTEGKGEGLGFENPKEFLRQQLKELQQVKREAREEKAASLGEKPRKVKKERVTREFAEKVKEAVWSRANKTQEEIFKHNFRDIAYKSMSKEERSELRRVMGWKSGIDPEKAGFTWNATTKRLEKKNSDGTTSWIRVNTERGRGKARYSSRTIEYGQE